MRVLALDHGEARCGCALSDPSGTLASPLEPVARPDSRAGLARLVALVREREVAEVVVGLPLRLDGGESEQTASARRFAARLAERLAPLGVPVALLDERLTTRQARASGGASSEDSRAAAHLLESWLARAGNPLRPGS
jgi:putative Holliday junction resolvase